MTIKDNFYKLKVIQNFLERKPSEPVISQTHKTTRVEAIAALKDYVKKPQ